MPVHHEKRTRAKRATLEILAADTVVCDVCRLPMSLEKRRDWMKKQPNRVRHLGDDEQVYVCSKCALPTCIGLRLRFVDRRPFVDKR